MNAKVTKISRYDDRVWDFWKEYHASKTPGMCRIIWNDVWERNPKMLETAKAYAWSLISGTATQRPITWMSVKGIMCKIAKFARLCESRNVTNFADLTVPLVTQLSVHLPQRRVGWESLRFLERMLEVETLPNIPDVSPFAGRKAQDWIKPDKVNQTRPLSDALIKDIIMRCVQYEADADELLQLEKSHDWNGAYAVRKGITNTAQLRREWTRTQEAGLIMMMASTGMRASEVISIERDGLVCVQGDTPYWCIQSKVFKFHGGTNARWVCGILGKRAVELLQRLTKARVLATGINGVEFKSECLNVHLCHWMAAQGWTDNEGMPLKIHSHQFRRTLARRLIRYPKVNLLAMRDQFKHKMVKMTEYYVGNDDELRHSILARYPEAAASVFQQKMRQKAGLGGAA